MTCGWASTALEYVDDAGFYRLVRSFPKEGHWRRWEWTLMITKITAHLESHLPQESLRGQSTSTDAWHLQERPLHWDSCVRAVFNLLWCQWLWSSDSTLEILQVSAAFKMVDHDVHDILLTPLTASCRFTISHWNCSNQIWMSGRR